MIATSMEDWNTWARTYTMLPYVQQFPLGQARVQSWERAWQDAADCSFVLESGKKGRYSFLGLHPTSTINGKGRQATVEHKQQEETINLNGDPFSLVKQWMAPFRAPKVENTPKFVGGCVGYWSYDVVRSLERIPDTAKDDLPCPDYYFMMIDELWIVDHEQQQLYCATHTPIDRDTGSDKLAQLYKRAGEETLKMKQRWDNIIEHRSDLAIQRQQKFADMKERDKLSLHVGTISDVQTAVKKEQFMKAVEQVQHYIRQGDVFQVNLSLRQSHQLRSKPEHIYEWLRLLNPSPYMGLLRFPGFQLVSASPELLIKLEGDKVSTRPIGGTRRRGRNEQEDRQLAEQLLSNDKERAEHVMLIDLERGDIGQIAKYGSVRVTDFMVLEYYSHVMHIVSEIEGQLAEGKDAYDVLAATFPGGTITGAPKIRTMEIIEELEPVRRGPYTGSMGWIGYDGNMQFNITIRTLLAVNQEAYVQAGAGIVLDSDPEREYVESLSKMKALWQAVQYSEL